MRSGAPDFQTNYQAELETIRPVKQIKSTEVCGK